MKLQQSVGFYVLPLLLAVLALSATILLAIPDDGRINLQAHFGGDAIYCVDANGNTTGDFASMDGGFQVLNLQGQAIWFVPAADIETAIADATLLNSNVLVASGTGTYGPTALHVRAENGVPVFTYVGTDEHGKQNQLEFRNCEPVGEREKIHGAAPDPSLCTIDEVNATEYLEPAFVTCSIVAGCGANPTEECFCAPENYGDSDICNPQIGS